MRGARTKEEFLAGLRPGRGYVVGAEGSYGKLAGDLLRIGGRAFQENPWMAAFVLILLLMPAVVLFHNAREVAFARLWAARIPGGRQRPPETAFSSAAPAIVSGGKE